MRAACHVRALSSRALSWYDASPRPVCVLSPRFKACEPQSRAPGPSDARALGGAPPLRLRPGASPGLAFGRGSRGVATPSTIQIDFSTLIPSRTPLRSFPSTSTPSTRPALHVVARALVVLATVGTATRTATSTSRIIMHHSRSFIIYTVNTVLSAVPCNLLRHGLARRQPRGSASPHTCCPRTTRSPRSPPSSTRPASASSASATPPRGTSPANGSLLSAAGVHPAWPA